ncbi:MAG TPA: methyltransferase domain-containing protein [Verrucomicrobiales bacterium]|nr:methyltransferase domain-containing protein [Verrucomicrobiales bacterium]HIL71057.1 methyltransferase domain-containing protein [Verrucomicrobiota bacterium]
MTRRNLHPYLTSIAFSGILLLTQPGDLFSQDRDTLEKSVNPGINRSYLRDDIKVVEWVERFEVEGREVYDHRDRIVKALGIQTGSTVADIGSGTGLFTALLAEAVGPEGRVYAVDIVEAFLKHVGDYLEKKEITNVETLLCSERSVKLPPASIDLAFICDVYHHFEYPNSSLASIHEALKPGGILVLVEFERIPGKSSNWILKHVRAGKETFSSEIVSAGFRKLDQADFLKENYLVRFQKVGK